MSNQDTLYVNCPQCQKPVAWGEQSPFRPFCSKRCQLIDLGEWANEEHRIAGDELIDTEAIWDENADLLQDDD